MSDTGIQIDNYANDTVIKSASKKSGLTTKFNKPAITIPTKEKDSICIENKKNSAWYSINIQDIRTSYLDQEYNRKLSELNETVNISCLERNG